MTTIEILGSHGVLIVDRTTGVIVDRERDGDGYDNIVLFDTTDIAREGGDTDILFVGYIYRVGDWYGYTPALAPTSGRDRHGEWAMAGDTMAYLPAPTAR